MKVVGSTGDTGVPGVFGQSRDGDGVSGLTFSDNRCGVSGVADMENGKGVFGQSSFGTGVFGKSTSGRGVQGWSDTNYGVTGDSHSFPGVRGTSSLGRGVEGWSDSGAGVFAISQHDIGVQAKGGRLAGFFEGHVEITGEIRMTNADFAEDFDVMEDCQPGEVVILTDKGILELSRKEYDKKAIGIISGAGNYKPGIILDKQNKSENRKPVAMIGKVCCKVDADSSPIEIGDLLTTSNVPGHAMKALDPFKAFGSVIGKALGSLKSGKGLMPVLVFLQ
ncbi:MAG: hypothetical protein IT249_08640 [Chitinophagaceae bacterium]|nr:hypothetical protein [Chitinophagaceae bacterium]